MMGEHLGRQDRLFYEFGLDDRVAADHLVRRLDAVLDLSWLRTEMSRAMAAKSSGGAVVTCQFRLCVRDMRSNAPFLRPTAFPPPSPPARRSGLRSKRSSVRATMVSVASTSLEIRVGVASTSTLTDSYVSIR